MAASIEALGIGGHEKFAEEIFGKIQALPPDLEIVELTKQQYDALTPEQKADSTKLYLVAGSATYPKFVEISTEDYEALTQEQKNDPSTVYFTPGTGTYFRVIDISAEDYEELTEEEKMDPQCLFLISDDTEYLTTTSAASTYLSKTDAASTYLSKTDAASTYGTKAEVEDCEVIEGSSTAVSSYEFTDDGGGVPFSSMIFEFESEQSGSGTPSPSNIRNFVGITGVEIEIAPDSSSSGTVVTCTFDNKQYSGTYDAISGKLTLEKEVITFDGTESFDRYEKVAPTIGTVYYVYESFIGAGHEETDEDNTNTKCSHYRVDSNVEPLADNLVAYVNGSNRVAWKHDSITTVSDMQTQLATWYANGTPLQFEATLTTPKVLYINPADIKTLKGNNYVTAKILYDDSTDEDADFKIEVLKNKLSAPMSRIASKVKVIDCVEQSAGSSSLLISDISAYGIMGLLEAGCDVVMRYCYEEKNDLDYPDRVTYKRIRYLHLEEYSIYTADPDDPQSVDTVTLKFTVNTGSGIDIYTMSTANGDTYELNKQF